MRLRGLIGSLLVATLGASDGASAIVGLPDPPAPAGHGRGIQVAPPAGTVALPEHKAPRHLVLKLRAEAANACVSCMLARQQPLGEVVPGSQLDALNHRFGVSAARPLLGAFAQKLIPEPHAHALAEYLGLSLPRWVPEPSARDQWKTVEAVRSQAASVLKNTVVSDQAEAIRLHPEERR